MTLTALPAPLPTSVDPAERAVIYARISRDREGAGLGVDRQEKDCRELAARLGLTVAEVYADNDISASSGRVRPDYRRMCADLDRPGAPMVVLTWHTDRLHRSPRELEDWIDLAEARGITVQTVKAGTIDLATSTGQMIARVLGAIAKQEVAHKAARIKGKMIEIRGEGRWTGGPVPFGWRRVPPESGTGHGTLVVDPAQARLIVEGTAALLAGRTVRSVVRAWQDSGVRPTRGGAWQAITVQSVLRRWRNAAVLEHRGQPAGPADWPAITADGLTITAAQVRAVRDAAAARSAASGGYGNRSAHLLSGIAVCGGQTGPAGQICGEPVRAAKGRGVTVYRCTTRGAGHVVRVADPLDDYVRGLIAGRLAMPDLADLLPTPGEGVDLAALRAVVARETAKLDQYAVMLADDDLDPASYRTATTRVRERLDTAERTLATSLRRSPLAPVLAAPDPATAFLAADIDTQRSVIRELVTVTLHRPPRGPRLDLDSVGIDWTHGEE